MSDVTLQKRGSELGLSREARVAVHVHSGFKCSVDLVPLPHGQLEFGVEHIAQRCGRQQAAQCPRTIAHRDIVYCGTHKQI